MKLKYIILCLTLAACSTSQYYPDEQDETRSTTRTESSSTSSPAESGITEPESFDWYYINATSVAQGYVTVWFDAVYTDNKTLDRVYVALNGEGKVVEPYAENEFEVKFYISEYVAAFDLVLGNPAFKTGSRSWQNAQKWSVTKTLTFNASTDESDNNAKPSDVTFAQAEPSNDGDSYLFEIEVEHDYASEELNYLWMRVGDQQAIIYQDDGVFTAEFEIDRSNETLDIVLGNGPFNRDGDLIGVGEAWELNYYIDLSEEAEEEEVVEYPKPDFRQLLEWTEWSSISWFLDYDYPYEFNDNSSEGCYGVWEDSYASTYTLNIEHCDDYEILNYTYHALSEREQRDFQAYYNSLKDELEPYYENKFKEESGQVYDYYEFSYGDVPYRVYLADDLESKGQGFEIHFEWDSGE